MRTPPIAIAALFWVLATAGLSAQVRTGPFPPGLGQGAGPGFATLIDPNQIGMIAIEPFEAARPVTGAPYTAEAVTDTTQVLADGNRIERRTTATIARDSRGRIRREQQTLPLGGLVVESPAPLVTISDPHSGTHMTLDAQRRVAVRVNGPRLVVSAAGDDDAARPRLRAGSARAVGVPEGVRTEPLGERVIEGVRSEGVRTTFTIGANAIGNQSPITVVSERWYSPELQVVVLTQRTDPRFGETVYRLRTIVRAEPPAHLFEVPAGYRIEDQVLPPPPRPVRRQ